MEDNANEIKESADTPETEEPERTQYTRQQSVMYTLISIALFCVLYFGGKQVLNVINRPYTVYLTPDAVKSETLPQAFDMAGLSGDKGLSFESAKLVKDEGGYAVTMLFSGFEDEEEFAESCIDFEYGDPETDVRTEFYPYPENPAKAEYAFATRYADIGSTGRSVAVFRYDGKLYAEYVGYGGVVPADVKAVFSGGEKVYQE